MVIKLSAVLNEEDIQCCLCPRLQLDIESEVNNEMANRMSLFYAEATPMLKTLSNATTSFVTEVRIALLLSSPWLPGNCSMYSSCRKDSRHLGWLHVQPIYDKQMIL